MVLGNCGGDCSGCKVQGHAAGLVNDRKVPGAVCPSPATCPMQIRLLPPGKSTVGIFGAQKRYHILGYGGI